MTLEDQIRDAVHKGDMLKAATLIGHPFTIIGEVIHNKGRGRKLKFPTANIDIREDPIIPRQGVYLARVLMPDNEWLPALANIGTRPTFPEDRGRLWLAVHIIDWDGDLYGKTIQVDFLAWVRSEEELDDPQELIEKMRRDLKLGREWSRKDDPKPEDRSR